MLYFNENENRRVRVDLMGVGMSRRSLLVASGLAMMALLMVGASQRHPNEGVIRLRFPRQADLTGLSIRYFLTGPFGGFGSFVRTDPNTREYAIDTFHDGRPATTLKAIIYCPGYRIVLLTDRRVAARSDVVVPVDLEPLGWVPLSGRLVSAPSRLPAWQDLRIEVQYMAYWSHTFYGITDGIVESFKVATTGVASDGSFTLSVPDFAADPVEAKFGSGVLRLVLREADSGNIPYSLGEVDGPGRELSFPIAPEYPRELLLVGLSRQQEPDE